ncbi:hypothetical protein ACFLZM_00440 [Thermodesulfobacteriota bacterium]
MISSPCKNCQRKNLPKEDCVKKCQLLQSIQEVLLSAENGYGSSGIDYTEENRYAIPSSLSRDSVYL